MAGKVGRSGRKKSLSTLMNEALERIDQALPSLIDAHIQKGVLWLDVQCPKCKHGFEIPGGGDREAREYLIDRRLGKAKVFSEIDMHQEMRPGEVVELFKMIQQTEREVEAEIKDILDKYFQEHPEINEPDWHRHLHNRTLITSWSNPERYLLKEGVLVPKEDVIEGEIIGELK